MRNEFLLSWEDMIRHRILPDDFPTQIQLIALNDLIGQLTSDFSDVFAATPAKSIMAADAHLPTGDCRQEDSHYPAGTVTSIRCRRCLPNQYR